jgi:uncharacterized protein (TIGR03437 family)
VDTQRTTGIAAALEGPLASGTYNQRINTNGRTMVVDAAGTTAYAVTTAGLSVIPIYTTLPSDLPQVTRDGIVNSASLQTAVAPNALVSILGKNLAQPASSSGYPLPTVLGGTCVTLNNTPLPLLVTADGQINAQLPPTLTAGRYSVVVRSIAKKAGSGTSTVSVAKYAPAVFTDSDGPLIYHKDGKRVSKDNPANRDEPLTLYATGLGATTGGKVVAGSPSPSSPLAVTQKVQLFFGNPLIK